MLSPFEQKMSEIYNAGTFERRRITRLMIESLEVAFYLCNNYTEEYSLTKIFDIVNWIMPTAYILNTGYWIFYSTHGGQPVCICLRFGLCCPHQRNDNHWVNIGSAQETEITPFSSIQLGKYWPIDFNIHVTPMINDALRSYDVLIKMTVQSYYTQDIAAAATTPMGFTLCTEIRYLMTPEYYPHESKIVQFTPHPLSHRNYGKYFMALHTYFDTFGSQSQFFYKNTIITSAFPKLTVIPYGNTFLANQNYSVNPRHSFNLSVSNEVSIAIYNEKNHKKVDNKTDSTHTTNTQENNVTSSYPSRFVDVPDDYFRTKSKLIQAEDFPVIENYHKQKRRRGKYNRASKEKITEASISTYSETPLSFSQYRESKPKDIYPTPGFYHSSFNTDDLEWKQNQGVRKKEKNILKCNNITGGDLFSLPDVIIENSRDANEYLEDISDIIKNEMKNNVEKVIKLEPPCHNFENDVSNLTNAPMKFFLSSNIN